MAEYIKTTSVLELVRGRIDKYRKKGVRDQLLYDTLRYLERRIRSKSNADVVAVVHGKWTPGNPYCPICGKDKFEGLDADVWADWMPPRCPNCGAIMDLED